MYCVYVDPIYSIHGCVCPESAKTQRHIQVHEFHSGLGVRTRGKQPSCGFNFVSALAVDMWGINGGVSLVVSPPGFRFRHQENLPSTVTYLRYLHLINQQQQPLLPYHPLRCQNVVWLHTDEI